MSDLQSKFDIIYNSNYPKVHRLCLGYTNGDEALAKDITQDVFIKVWENLGTFRNESSLPTWIYRITVNTCLMSLRKKKPVDISSHLNVLQSTEDAVQEEDKSNKIKQLYSCINTLNSHGKSIILLELEGLPQKEIADVMGMSHEAIRVRIHRIKEKLTKCVKK
ncbi:RNA polymerase sigma factor [Algibacter mikhailovii]|uniref:DNA-directed RNA polymerase sigma-70 factor n=1 Tax=Algibacter mikhailovii TaxID=425498 RepID=A0A918VBI7_9FLAO|nr:sigma-70 family RNA polymerase sigma factor [Algibacter mikhailovii]GGZ88995.1 DNA-directed RNA polymerase sigma-70 factor [Algibacter mikhailovii]